MLNTHSRPTLKQTKLSHWASSDKPPHPSPPKPSIANEAA